MCSHAAYWRDGQQIWSVYHNGGDRGTYDLQIQGNPPHHFSEIRDRLNSQQVQAGGEKADVDHIFDVPVELARSITGYRHDQDIPELGKLVHNVLVKTQNTSRRSWF
jgi:hypothetical protein